MSETHEFLVNGNPQNIPKKKGGNNMFYCISQELAEEHYPELVQYEPNKTRCFYTYSDGVVRWFDRINGYYFSDKPWGISPEMLAEGIDQEFTDNYLSLNIRNKAFMDAFTSGQDVHTLVGISTFGEEKYFSDKKKYRKIAKVLNFNMQYGGTPFGVARMLGVSQEEAQKIYDDYMTAMKDHFDVQDAQVRATHKYLCEHSFFGLPIRLARYYNNPNDRKNVSQGERLARNSRIQASGADILSIAFMKLWGRIWRELGSPEDYVRFQITVHDEIDFLVRNDVAHIIVPIIIDCMTFKLDTWPITLEVGLSCGPTFGQQYEWDYEKTDNGFKVLGPKLEEEKPKKKEEPKEEVQKEEIKIEF